MKPKIQIDRSKLIDLNPPIPSVMGSVRACDSCGQEYQALTWNCFLWTTGLCFECSDKDLEENKDEEIRGHREKRVSNFRELCPESYRDFKKHLIPNPSVYEKILEWDYKSKKGLILVGDSGMGKTRCAWQLMKRLYLIEYIQFMSITELQFSHEVAKFGKSDTLSDWLNKLCTCKVLFIDDLGKSVMTERVTTELFYVLEERTKHLRPCVITMQIESGNLYQKFSVRSGKEIAEAILNRLKAHCEIINF